MADKEKNINFYLVKKYILSLVANQIILIIFTLQFWFVFKTNSSD